VTTDAVNPAIYSPFQASVGSGFGSLFEVLSLDVFLHDFRHPSIFFWNIPIPERASAKPAELPGCMSCHRIATGRCQFLVATDVARILVIGAMEFD
jgi:hypothetical protein